MYIEMMFIVRVKQMIIDSDRNYVQYVELFCELI